MHFGAYYKFIPGIYVYIILFDMGCKFITVADGKLGSNHEYEYLRPEALLCS